MFPLRERIAQHRKLPRGYDSDSGEESDREPASSASNPGYQRPLHCDYEALIWQRFCQMVIDGIEAPAGTFGGPHSDEYCKSAMEKMYQQALDSVLFEDDCASRF